MTLLVDGHHFRAVRILEVASDALLTNERRVLIVLTNEKPALPGSTVLPARSASEESSSFLTLESGYSIIITGKSIITWSGGRMSRSNVHFEGVEILPEKSMTAAALEHGVYQLVGPILPQILKQLKFKVMSK